MDKQVTRVARFTRVKAWMYAMCALVMTSPAFAQGTPAEFDTAPILAKIALFAGFATALVSAMLAVRWGVHLYSLLRPRG